MARRGTGEPRRWQGLSSGYPEIRVDVARGVGWGKESRPGAGLRTRRSRSCGLRTEILRWGGRGHARQIEIAVRGGAPCRPRPPHGARGGIRAPPRAGAGCEQHRHLVAKSQALARSHRLHHRTRGVMVHRDDCRNVTGIGPSSASALPPGWARRGAPFGGPSMWRGSPGGLRDFGGISRRISERGTPSRRRVAFMRFTGRRFPRRDHAC